MRGPDHVSPASGEISFFMEANLCPVSSPHLPEYSLFQPPAPAVGVLRNQQMSNSGMDAPSSPRQPPAQPTPRPPSWTRVSTVPAAPSQGTLLDKGLHGAPLSPPPPCTGHPPGRGSSQCPRPPHRAPSWTRVSTVLHPPLTPPRTGRPPGRGLHGAPSPIHFTGLSGDQQHVPLEPSPLWPTWGSSAPPPAPPKA